MNVKLKPIGEQVMVITGASSGIGLLVVDGMVGLRRSA